MKDSLAFDDILLEPQYSEIESRSDVDISSNICNLEFKIPIIASPMDRVVGENMCDVMVQQEGLALIHRYQSIEKVIELLMSLYEKHGKFAYKHVGIAIGVDDYKQRVVETYDIGCRIYCVDVAHGHHIKMKRCLEWLREQYQDEIVIIAGNVATYEGVKDLVNWGVNMVRCNIGGGSSCSTRLQTGHGIGSVTTLLQCKEFKYEKPFVMIADGGIKNTGDILKALACGSDMIMLGRMLASTSCSPGLTIEVNGKKYKEYRGMASVASQLEFKNNYRSIEGVSGLVPYEGDTTEKLKEIAFQIKTGLSYSGARNLDEFRGKAKWRIQTNASLKEGRPFMLD